MSVKTLLTPDSTPSPAFPPTGVPIKHIRRGGYHPGLTTFPARILHPSFPSRPVNRNHGSGGQDQGGGAGGQGGGAGRDKLQ